MKVYILYYRDDYDRDEVLGIYSTKEKANAELAEVLKSKAYTYRQNRFSIEEEEVQ